MPPPTLRHSAAGNGATLFAFFGLVVFLRLWLVREWGSPIPYLDQWDAEALGLYLPWLDGSLSWTQVLRAHNEHRIVLTRLTDLLLFAGLGRWDTWGQLILNAVLNAGTATLLLAIFQQTLARAARSVFAVALIGLFTTPSGWQNALWGFQSQCYFATGLSCLAVVGLLGTAPVHRLWWVGWGAALAALFSQSSGVFAGLVVAATTGLAAVCVRAARRQWAVFALIILPVALGLLLRVEEPGHRALQAQSVAQFFAVFLRCLAWPGIERPLLALVMYAPIGWLVVHLLRSRRQPTPAEACALGLALLGVCNAGAIAFSRGAGLIDHLPLSRYQDALLPGVVANLYLVLVSWPRARPARLAAAGWCGLLLLGGATLAAGSLTTNLPFKRLQNQLFRVQIDGYLATRSQAVFAQGSSWLRPHPDTALVATVLDTPALQRHLPPVLRGEPDPSPPLIGYAPLGAALCAAALAIALVRRRTPETGPA
jgi:hypothetical protein